MCLIIGVGKTSRRWSRNFSAARRPVTTWRCRSICRDVRSPLSGHKEQCRHPERHRYPAGTADSFYAARDRRKRGPGKDRERGHHRTGVVNIWNDSGTPKVRKADADDPTKYAQGFILADVLNGEDVIVYLSGKVTGLSGLTPGALQFLSSTGGQVTATPPTGSGKIVQQLGTALSSTTMNFEPQPAVQLA
jgi:hypothetical protein